MALFGARDGVQALASFSWGFFFIIPRDFNYQYELAMWKKFRRNVKTGMRRAS
jgi:hypothetical protein